MASGGSGVKQDAFGSYGNATGQANNAYNVANPIYTQMAEHPQGFTPQEKANQLTASADALGGSNASAVGTGALTAARTNNAGGYAAAVDDAARNAAATQSDNALGIENKDAMLRRSQQAEGLSGLQNTYNDANKTGADYLDIANKAQPTFWQQMALAAGTPVAKAAGGAASSFLFGA
jgi:hypothetical protein